MIIDLHSHSNTSDGHLSPEQLVSYAVTKGVQVLALTDHDTVAGIKPAQQAIEHQNLPLLLIPGVEFSTLWHGFEIHIVGLKVQTDHPALNAFIALQQQRRVERAKKICHKLVQCGFMDAENHFIQMIEQQMVTRAHFATYLKELGAVSTLQQAFDRYLGRRKKAYVAPDWPPIEEAVKAIQEAGGVAVLAHPSSYDMTGKWLRRLIVAFVEAGGDAMEVVQVQQSPDERRHIAALCAEYGLKGSMGCDFHTTTPWLDLGIALKLPDNVTPVWSDWTEFRAMMSEDA